MLGRLFKMAGWLWLEHTAIHADFPSDRGYERRCGKIEGDEFKTSIVGW